MLTLHLPSNYFQGEFEFATPLYHCFSADAMVKLPNTAAVYPAMLVAAWNYAKLGRRVILCSFTPDDSSRIGDLIANSPDFWGTDSEQINSKTPAAQRRKVWNGTSLIVANLEITLNDMLSGNIGFSAAPKTILLVHGFKSKIDIPAIYAEVKKRFPVIFTLWTGDPMTTPPRGCPILNWPDWHGTVFPDSVTLIQRPFCISLQPRNSPAEPKSQQRMDFIKLPPTFAEDSRVAVANLLRCPDLHRQAPKDIYASSSKRICHILQEGFLEHAYEILRLVRGGYREKWER